MSCNTDFVAVEFDAIFMLTLVTLSNDSEKLETVNKRIEELKKQVSSLRCHLTTLSSSQTIIHNYIFLSLWKPKLKQ